MIVTVYQIVAVKLNHVAFKGDLIMAVFFHLLLDEEQLL